MALHYFLRRDLKPIKVQKYFAKNENSQEKVL